MYKRVVVKLSGEALSGEGDGIFDKRIMEEISASISAAAKEGIGFAIVIGAGNIWRGGRQEGVEIDRVRGDHMGMLATVINSIAMQDFLIKQGLEAIVMSAVPIGQFCETYSQDQAIRHMAEGRIVILACGVGYPFFSTDTGMMLRAAELKADLVLSAKAIDGVYDKDPNIYPDAIKYDEVSYDEIIEKKLKVIDQTAAAFGREYDIKVMLFTLSEANNIYKAAMGEKIGTLIK